MDHSCVDSASLNQWQEFKVSKHKVNTTAVHCLKLICNLHKIFNIAHVFF